MKAEKLPSGNWRVRVSIKTPDGRYTTRSFTAEKKSDVLKMASLAKYDPKPQNMRVEEACRKFLTVRGKELSPTTMRGYLSTYRQYIEKDPIAVMKLDALGKANVQEWIYRMPDGMSSKTKKNHLGFLLTVVGFFLDDKRIKVKIREEEPKDLYTPTAEDINKVLSVADPVLERAIRLGLFGMRRGEICALTASDIDREKCQVRISKALAKGPDGKWVTKSPKTKSSVRWVQLPKEVIGLLPKTGRIVPVNPDVITLRFIKAQKRAGVQHFRFHDLRAFFASISVSSAIGSSELTVQEIGGWKTTHVLRKHYERSISDQRKKDTEKIFDYFSENVPVKKAK